MIKTINTYLFTSLTLVFLLSNCAITVEDPFQTNTFSTRDTEQDTVTVVSTAPSMTTSPPSLTDIDVFLTPFIMNYTNFPTETTTVAISGDVHY